MSTEEAKGANEHSKRNNENILRRDADQADQKSSLWSALLSDVAELITVHTREAIGNMSVTSPTAL